MKSFHVLMTLLVAGFLFAGNLSAQEDKAARPSPPAEAMAMIGDAKVSILYSSPSVKGRAVWGALVPYGKVWRTGANEATVFETSADLKINGKSLPAGKYALFSIPGEKEWTFIFNSAWEQWGAYRYDEAKDVLRVTATPKKSDAFHERLLFALEDHMAILRWENLEVSFTVKQ